MAAPGWSCRADAEDQGVALPASAAQRRGAGSAASAPQFEREGQDQAGAAHANRVAQGDGSNGVAYQTVYRGPREWEIEVNHVSRVVAALTDVRDRFRIVVNAVEVVPPSAPLPRLPVGRAVWKPAPDFRTSAAARLTAGAAHHTAMSTAVGVEAFRDDARMASTEVPVIEETTTVRELERQVTANAAYYRLARGI